MSWFPIVRRLASMTAHQIADHLKQIFSEYGWPETLISDNGPCYASETFKKLMKEYNVNHVTSSPHYPQSKNLAEKYVQIVKNLFHKAKEEGQDLHKCLMMYRNTLCQALCNPQCKCSWTEQPDQIYHCQQQTDYKWFYTSTIQQMNRWRRTITSQHMTLH